MNVKVSVPVKGKLAGTKLCESVIKSTTGHTFDCSVPREYRPILEYNNLHDPHLRDYFYKPRMKKKLIEDQFITSDLRVLCQRKEFNAYCTFLEQERLKLQKGKKEEMKNEMMGNNRAVTSKMSKRREESRKRYISAEEKKLMKKREEIHKMELNEKLKRRKMLEMNHIRKVKEDITKQVDLDKIMLKQLTKELKTSDNSAKMKIQEEMKKIERNKESREGKLLVLKEFESRWNEYNVDDKHIQEDERKKMQFLKKREIRIIEREKKLDEKRKIDQDTTKLRMSTHESGMWVHRLKKQAGQQREWEEMREILKSETTDIQQQRKQLEIQLRLRREAWRKEHEKLLDSLLSIDSVAAYSRKYSNILNLTKENTNKEEEETLHDIPVQYTSNISYTSQQVNREDDKTKHDIPIKEENPLSESTVSMIMERCWSRKARSKKCHGSERPDTERHLSVASTAQLEDKRSTLSISTLPSVAEAEVSNTFEKQENTVKIG